MALNKYNPDKVMGIDLGALDISNLPRGTEMEISQSTKNKNGVIIENKMVIRRLNQEPKKEIRWCSTGIHRTRAEYLNCQHCL